MISIQVILAQVALTTALDNTIIKSVRLNLICSITRAFWTFTRIII